MTSFAKLRLNLSNWSAPALTGLLLGLSFLDSRLAWLGLVAIVPYLYFLDQKPRFGRLIKATYLMGLISMALTLIWIWQINPRDWLLIAPTVSRALIISVWIISSFVFALGFLITALVLGWFRPRQVKLLHLIVAWIIGEWSRAWLFSIISAGVGSTIGPHWHFGNLGLLFPDLGLGVLGRTFGLSGLSALVIAINYTLFRLLKNRSLFPLASTSLVFIGGWAVSTLPYPQNSQPPIRVASVQINDPDNQKYYAAVSSATPSNHPKNLVVLPEYSEFFTGLISEDQGITRRQLLETWLQNRSGLVITSQTVPYRPKQPDYNQLQAFDQTERILNRQNKWFLIPAGEYVPYVYLPFLKRFQQQTLADFADRRAISKAKTPERPLVTPPLRIGALACSGVVSPELYRNITRQKVDLLTNSAALGYFNQSRFFHHQTAQMIRFDAAANAKPFIQSTIEGRSYIFDQAGRKLAASKPVTGPRPPFEVIEAEVTPNRLLTFYTRFGEVGLCLAIAALAGMGLTRPGRTRFNKHKRKNSTDG